MAGALKIHALCLLAHRRHLCLVPVHVGFISGLPSSVIAIGYERDPVRPTVYSHVRLCWKTYDPVFFRFHT